MAFVDVCVTSDHRSVLVKNTSSLLLQVQANSGSSLRPVEYVTSGDFADMVYADLARNLTIQVSASVVIPPAGYVIADSLMDGQAQVLVQLPLLEAGAMYAANQLLSYVQTELTHPAESYAKRVADCATEVADTWNNVQVSADTSMSWLLADTALGPGLSCGGLIQDVMDEAGKNRPSTYALQTEFDKFTSRVKASVWDDLVRMTRNVVRVAR